MRRENSPKSQRLVAVLWPSFLVSGVATVVIFVMFDPRPRLASTDPAELSRVGAYSIGFSWCWLNHRSRQLVDVLLPTPPRGMNGPRSKGE